MLRQEVVLEELTLYPGQVNEFKEMLRSSEQDVGLGHEERGAILRKQFLIRVQGAGPCHRDQKMLRN